MPPHALTCFVCSQKQALDAKLILLALPNRQGSCRNPGSGPPQADRAPVIGTAMYVSMSSAGERVRAFWAAVNLIDCGVLRRFDGCCLWRNSANNGGGE